MARQINLGVSPVAQEIFNQLGNAMMVACIGVNGKAHTENSLTLRFKARAKDAIKAFRVTLDPSDTYTVTFLKGNLETVVKEESDVYCDSLVQVVESATGLYLGL